MEKKNSVTFTDKESKFGVVLVGNDLQHIFKALTGVLKSLSKVLLLTILNQPFFSVKSFMNYWIILNKTFTK